MQFIKKLILCGLVILLFIISNGCQKEPVPHSMHFIYEHIQIIQMNLKPTINELENEHYQHHPGCLSCARQWSGKSREVG